MKTPIPNAITSIEEAKAWLKALHSNNEEYHPEDDAHDIINGRTGQPLCTKEEADKLNALMGQIYAMLTVSRDGDGVITLSPFDPCGYLIDLDKAQNSPETATQYAKRVYGLDANDLDLVDSSTIEDVERYAQKYDLTKAEDMTEERAQAILKQFN